MLLKVLLRSAESAVAMATVGQTDDALFPNMVGCHLVGCHRSSVPSISVNVNRLAGVAAHMVRARVKEYMGQQGRLENSANLSCQSSYRRNSYLASRTNVQLESYSRGLSIIISSCKDIGGLLGPLQNLSKTSYSPMQIGLVIGVAGCAAQAYVQGHPFCNQIPMRSV